jgi:ABC-type dipeptide/oligopeptide/nickel transport system permease component
MPKLTLSHFETAVLFALFTSVVMGIVSKQTDKERIRYGFRCFAWFMVALFAIAWAMRLGHG